VTFDRAALAAAAERGGDKTCPSCGASALFYGYRYERTSAGTVEVVCCPACIETPLRRPWVVRQPTLPGVIDEAADPV
jgi:uncharacterized protein (DUF983 family)